MCFFSPIRNDPKKHINNFSAPTQSRDNPANLFMFMCFFFPCILGVQKKTRSGLKGVLKRDSERRTCLNKFFEAYKGLDLRGENCLQNAHCEKQKALFKRPFNWTGSIFPLLRQKRFNRSLVCTRTWRGFCNCRRTLKTAERRRKSWKRAPLSAAPISGMHQTLVEKISDFISSMEPKSERTKKDYLRKRGVAADLRRSA